MRPRVWDDLTALVVALDQKQLPLVRHWWSEKPMPAVLALETRRCVSIHERASTDTVLHPCSTSSSAGQCYCSCQPVHLLRGYPVPISTDRLPELSQCGSLPVIYSSDAMTWTATLANAVLMLECMFAVHRRRYSKGATKGIISFDENVNRSTHIYGG